MKKLVQNPPVGLEENKRHIRSWPVCPEPQNLPAPNRLERKGTGQTVLVYGQLGMLEVIRRVNDDEECLRGIARRIKNELGEDTPWHLTRYYPAYKFAKDAYVPATSAKALEKVREIGREEGLNYVYVGNLPGHPFENTYCPNCEELLIKRYGFSVSRYNIKDGKSSHRY